MAAAPDGGWGRGEGRRLFCSQEAWFSLDFYVHLGFSIFHPAAADLMRELGRSGSGGAPASLFTGKERSQSMAARTQLVQAHLTSQPTARIEPGEETTFPLRGAPQT